MIRLPHWRITDKTPAFYDVESATAIEQTAKLYGAMQSLIDEYNEFVDGVNKDIDSFENSSEKNYEDFTVAMAQKFQDFIDIIDLKINEQNKTINEQNKTINDSTKAMKEEIEEMLVLLRDEVLEEDIVIEWNWITGNIDNNTGEWVDNEDGDSYAHTDFINVPKGYDITSDSNTIIDIYEYDSVTKEFIGYLAGVSGETYTTTKNVTICMVVREYSSVITPNVTITTSNASEEEIESLAERVETVESSIENLSQQITTSGLELETLREATENELSELNKSEDLHSASINNLSQRISNAESQISILGETVDVDYGWDSGKIDSYTGELVESTEYEETTEFLELPLGSTITASGTPVVIYFYDVDTHNYLDQSKSMTDGEIYNTTEKVLVRITAGAKATVFIKIHTVKEKIEELEGKTIKTLYYNNNGSESATMTDNATNYSMLIVNYEAHYNVNIIFGSLIVYNPSDTTYDSKSLIDSDTYNCFNMQIGISFTGKTFTTSCDVNVRTDDDVISGVGSVRVMNIFGFKA